MKRSQTGKNQAHQSGMARNLSFLLRGTIAVQVFLFGLVPGCHDPAQDLNVCPPSMFVPGEIASEIVAIDESGLIEPIFAGSSTASNGWPQESVESSAARATSHPHGTQVCASGCAVSRHPTPEFKEAHFHQLWEEYLRQSPSLDSQVLDELIFYGPQTKKFLKTIPGEKSSHRAFLQQELAKDQLVLEIRVVDEFGVSRLALPPTTVPQHVRQEFVMNTQGIQPALTSGTLKRVGLRHIWQRL
ncbi:MAG: hypothetical protein AAF483_04305 [Planctomycetota bacterium]